MESIEFNSNQLIINSREILNRFALESLLEKKWITKSFTTPLSFIDVSSSRSAQSRIIKIIMRELLKGYCFLKQSHTINGSDKLLKLPEVGTSLCMFFLVGVPGSVLTRYVNKLNHILAINGFPYLLRVEHTTIYNGWNAVGGGAEAIVLYYDNYLDNQSNRYNPYKIFLILEEILRFVKTISKYTPIINRVDNTLTPLYQSKLRLNNVNEQRRSATQV